MKNYKILFIAIILAITSNLITAQQWYNVGNAQFSDGSVPYISMTIYNGTPYVVYSDSYGQKATVKKLNTATSLWDNVGADKFSASSAYFTSIAIDNNGTPYVVYSDANVSSKATVKKFNGTAWETVGSAGISDGEVTSNQIKIDKQGVPYIAYIDKLNPTIPTVTVKRYKNGAWETVGGAPICGKAESFSMAIDNNDVPYIAYSDGDRSEAASVKKLNGSNWDYVGVQGFSNYRTDNVSIAIDNSGTPYVVFTLVPGTTYPLAMKYTNGSWSYLANGAYVENVYATNTKISIDDKGTPYVAFTAISNSTLAVKKYTGSTWQAVGSQPVSTGAVPYLSFSASTGVPCIAYQDGSGGKATVIKFTNKANDPLPVELTAFTASSTNNGVKLAWSTATEVNNNKFEVERQAVSSKPSAVSQWTKVGEVSGNGNSNSVKNYSFTDTKATAGKYAYRLKQIDNDGTYKYSSEVSVELDKPTTFAMNQNYPNPFNPSTVLSYKLSVLSNVELKIYDVLGKEVASLVNEKQEAGSYSVKFDASKLSSGMYIAKLNAGSFSKSIKMNLVK